MHTQGSSQDPPFFISQTALCHMLPTRAFVPHLSLRTHAWLHMHCCIRMDGTCHGYGLQEHRLQELGSSYSKRT